MGEDNSFSVSGDIPDNRKVSRTEKEMAVSAGTIIGPYHVRQGVENQDAYYFLEEGEFTVIAVADGAGSLPKSAIGAQLASATAVNETIDALQDGRSFQQAIALGIEKARVLLLSREDSHQIGCTLAVAAMSNTGGWGAGVVGDAFALISTNIDEHSVIQPKSSAEFANVTKLLTSRDYDPLIESGTEEIVAIVASSDGLTNTSMVNGKASQKFWSPIIARAIDDNMDVQAFLYYMNDNERIYDDTTLVIATK